MQFIIWTLTLISEFVAVKDNIMFVRRKLVYYFKLEDNEISAIIKKRHEFVQTYTFNEKCLQSF